MTGIALSVTFLDDELEKLWLAPADTPAFKLGNASAARGERRVVKELYEDVCYEEGSPASRAAASFIVLALERMQKAIEKNEEELARIDAVAGDGDHGRGMPDVQDNYLAVCQVRW